MPKRPAKNSPRAAGGGDGGGSATTHPTSGDTPKSAGYLLTCDVPTKEYIRYLNNLKSTEERFILVDLDATHLLIKKKARAEVLHEVEVWQSSNVFSSLETVGENLDVS